MMPARGLHRAFNTGVYYPDGNLLVSLHPISQILWAESPLAFSMVLSDEKSGGAAVQQALCGIALKIFAVFRALF